MHSEEYGAFKAEGRRNVLDSSCLDCPWGDITAAQGLRYSSLMSTPFKLPTQSQRQRFFSEHDITISTEVHLLCETTGGDCW